MIGLRGCFSRQRICGRCKGHKRNEIANDNHIPGISAPGMWLSLLLGRVSVLGQESEQVGITLQIPRFLSTRMPGRR